MNNKFIIKKSILKDYNIKLPDDMPEKFELPISNLFDTTITITPTYNEKEDMIEITNISLVQKRKDESRE